MAGRKLNLVKFKKAAIDFSTKYLTCFKCFELIDHAKLLVCNHRFCSKCRENGEPCPICQAVEDGSLQPMGELLEIFGALQQSLGIEKKIRQKCFEKMYSNLITEKTNTQGEPVHLN